MVSFRKPKFDAPFGGGKLDTSVRRGHFAERGQALEPWPQCQTEFPKWLKTGNAET
jgi:hypothetical protein